MTKYSFVAEVTFKCKFTLIFFNNIVKGFYRNNIVKGFLKSQRRDRKDAYIPTECLLLYTHSSPPSMSK